MEAHNRSAGEEVDVGLARRAVDANPAERRGAGVTASPVGVRAIDDRAVLHQAEAVGGASRQPDFGRVDRAVGVLPRGLPETVARVGVKALRRYAGDCQAIRRRLRDRGYGGGHQRGKGQGELPCDRISQ